MAALSRDFATGLAAILCAPGGQVRVASTEMRIWKLSPWLTLPNDASWGNKLEALYPQTPAPESRGGRDIEAALFDLLAKNPADTLYLVLTPGPSQLPSDGTGSLLSEQAPAFVKRLNERGYRPLSRRSFTTDGEKSRHLMLTVLAPEELSLKAAGNLPMPIKGGPKPTNTPPASAGASIGKWLLVWIPIGIAVAGFVVYRTLNKKPAEPATQPETEPKGSDATEAPALNMRKIQRALDMISQDLAESAQQLSNSTKTIETQIADVGLLRQEVRVRESQIEEWVDVAMTYLESLNRIVNSEGLPDDRKSLIKKAAVDFARLCSRNGLDVIMPAPGEAIVPGLHEVVDSNEDGEIVAYCKHWGYKQGPNVLKKAVVVAAD